MVQGLGCCFQGLPSTGQRTIQHVESDVYAGMADGEGPGFMIEGPGLRTLGLGFRLVGLGFRFSFRVQERVISFYDWVVQSKTDSSRRCVYLRTAGRT